MSQELRVVGEWLLPSVAYGDAAGLPWENYTAAMMDERGHVNQLMDLSVRYHHTRLGRTPGTWSDDTQMSLAVTKSLVRKDRFDLDDQAACMIEAHDQIPVVDVYRDGKTLLPLGWGESLPRAVNLLRSGISPDQSGEPGGMDDGALMKMAPLVYWQMARQHTDKQSYAELDAMTRMTHDTDAIAIASRVHADVLRYCFETGPKGIHDLGEFAIAQAAAHESALAADDTVSSALGYLGAHQTISRDVILDCTDGRGIEAPQTLAMAYGAYRSADTFANRVYAAVNNGGDTDTLASVVASMSLFADKNPDLPRDAHKLAEYPRLQIESRRLAACALHMADEPQILHSISA